MFWTCLLFLAYGLIVFPSSVKTQDLTRTCSYAGVFHIEQRGRYFLTYPEAEKLCLSMGTVLASREDVNRAYSKGFETCRYGWIQNISVAIIRQQAHDRCAANSTGVLVLSANLTVRYDAYCYNSSDSSDKNCDLALVTIPHPLEKSEDGVDSFPPTGKPTPTPDKAEDETERSPGGEEKPTATTTENPQEERPQVRTTMDPAESKGITVPLPSDDETTTPANSSGIIPLVNDGFQHEKEKGENISDNSTTEIDLKPGFENRTDAASSGNTTGVARSSEENVDNGYSPDNSTMEPDPESEAKHDSVNSTKSIDSNINDNTQVESTDDNNRTTTPVSSDNSREDAVQSTTPAITTEDPEDVPLGGGDDSTLKEKDTDTQFSTTVSTPRTKAAEGADDWDLTHSVLFLDDETTPVFTSLSPGGDPEANDVTPSADSLSENPFDTGTESSGGKLMETPKTTARTNPSKTHGSRRMIIPQTAAPPDTERHKGHKVPDWLIILAVVVAVVVIFLVCIAIATRHRWCGKKQKLVITSKPGRDGNGAAGSTKADREQEMVQLMNKEKIQENGGNAEEFTVIALEDSPEKS